MNRDDISDPRTFRWVESGVSGLARAREWDLVAIVELPELETADVAEFSFRAPVDGPLELEGHSWVQPETLERLARAIESSLDRPYAASAVRQSGREWSLAVAELRIEPIDLPRDLEASVLQVALAPGGEPERLVDEAEPAGPPPPRVEAALAELERIGRSRFRAFVARADKTPDGRWELTVDPL